MMSVATVAEEDGQVACNNSNERRRCGTAVGLLICQATEAHWRWKEVWGCGGGGCHYDDRRCGNCGGNFNLPTQPGEAQGAWGCGGDGGGGAPGDGEGWGGVGVH